MDAEQGSLEEDEGFVPHPTRDPEDERHARYDSATDALFAPEINVCGLGLLMFMADGGISNLHLVGPQGLTHALAALRLYAYRSVLSFRF